MVAFSFFGAGGVFEIGEDSERGTLSKGLGPGFGQLTIMRWP